MPSYVAFLRAINLGPKRKVKMADLRECLTEAGFDDVDTHIQTGNVRLTTSMRSASKVAERIENVLKERFGFEIPTMVFTCKDLAQVYDDALAIEPPPYAGEDHAGRYVVLYKVPPKAEQVREVAAYEHDKELGVIVGRAAHLWVSGGLMDGQIFKAFNKVFEPGTNRNLRVIRTCVEKWC